MGPVLDPQLVVENGSYCLHKAYEIFDELISCGNRVAAFRKSELLQLAGMLNSLPPDQHATNPLDHAIPSEHGVEYGMSGTAAARGRPSVGLSSAALSLSTPISASTLLDDDGFGHPMTAAQILDIANSIDSMDTDCISQAIFDHCSE